MSGGEKMDVDVAAAAGGGDAAGGGALKVHPLALIAISDHFTRVVTGGSALPPGAPVVGLLFGHQDGRTVSVLDAAEAEQSFAAAAATAGADYSSMAFGGGTEEEQAQHKAGLKTKIELHQKVFPTHEVVGWYRVSSDGDGGPTEQDLQTNNGKMRDLNESPLFLLMNAGKPGGNKADADSNDTEKAAASDSAEATSSAGQAAREKLDRDEQLPVLIYESLVTVDQAAVFVNLEFELETFEPERIAVENVFKAQRQVASVATTAIVEEKVDDAKMQAEETTTTAKDNIAAALNIVKGTTGTGDASSTSAPPPPSELDAHFQTMKSSIESMNDRVAVLIDYLRRTQNGEIEPDYALLRQVDGLVRRLPLLMTSQSQGLEGEFESEFDNALVLSYLAAVTKTAKAVRIVTDKSLLVMDGSKDSFRRVV